MSPLYSYAKRCLALVDLLGDYVLEYVNPAGTIAMSSDTVVTRLRLVRAGDLYTITRQMHLVLRYNPVLQKCRLRRMLLWVLKRGLYNCCAGNFIF